ncbi:MBL fold metallo-hydrolase [Sulfitobacter mediterraneus]|uniref:MBL fold metallo-hydrolase n=1 Tax=Sulfitobacter mediterraneus TaxID=83219 RepID=UPI00193369BE|nr:MBL fold metallo-hydrolase [Sulfitobacter mediterraneus]MBM1631615.1 MBL fold metallo-hydrolase [Sulfitobacter mediterraneus]MBM1639430.1 MBL fold metallo-hydrolase [Sulfitobacter mediterraneus]MBM1643479.1 MBL fold metallo-hydrolase [Sulfitobacter mediterraneus]MBM1647525.1 MBL fold metallo-hydrolase [Sulfitobacter mediterraneus]MBM1651570.1 MBL fold metallo-hydrolase [Sulfitobacter mediterraneus]
MAQMRITILGCGSSGGVPRLGGHWGACDPEEPKNRRGRCSALVERIGPEGTTSVLIDTSPDMRQQLLNAGVSRLDAVLYTHSHADHVHGLDDLRMIVINMRARLPVWADAPTRAALLERFGYAFIRPEGSMYPPILDMHDIEGDVTIDGPGGALNFTPFLVNHGGMDALGFKMNNVAYLPDVATIPDDVWPHLQGLRCWIVDALRRDPHPTHSHLDQTLQWIADMAPQEAVLTNMHNDLDYQTLRGELPAHISPAYDGMTLNFEID